MSLKGKRIGFGLTGSHCTYDEVFPEIEKLVNEGAEVIPIVTSTVQNTETRFGKGEDWVERIEKLTGNHVVDTIVKAEPLGPKLPLDCMVIAPLTGNSMSKMANALTDSPVLMAAKATMRNHRPVVVAISTNDALGLNGVNLMRLMAAKDIYFVPYGQDNPTGKPSSMVARMSMIRDTIISALEREQIQPVIVERFKDDLA
ncbi:dipicolinate synthase subunit B [Peribacillus castrilensis]|jgi:dipicolinate synthase subunit B|uniref:Dipicolinate synthase subunit B n=3 Tax=Peribacillus TaxID=2675229 RepID=A0A098FAU7_9BACI|nr:MULTISPECIES: dipicolinate synthase subunit B [Bacillaceae]KOR78194.1 dipicolinate synthase subunit B [Bacillus sp. FJAT-21352]KOR83659.1 dipicolinate synthase subunit B [Bacillus sp. FJAT-22058]KRF50315.1 dipicolinate synthase subunit B [Bacillus sp. Soil745]MBD8134013.1 dipicolinate synthase subunit B [Bacillus sp. CFBP 13597]MBL3641898.1 dipicolinate synthase subunit B [Bacillus sp. RHFB]MCD1160440.1 dipicolinate synthase subunit B [Peribacillus castrilensis]MCP1093098.1 dipicolinate s